ncbi:MULTISPECIES: 5-formyltetrahydrofolate cyclo-ligase [Thalassospira]|uniref:5-formyltetrahydrofolate cyclo-ligase n=1 Tax=Thalassospira profundimaris TaxID=502049 RepID=A0A367V7G0_9PROT|nr:MULTISPECIES: 5-formyltetrahydrofolate cyclo-ligase [Thalassospira]KZB70402.1 5-formyltetrahydrofolate cyclo-ligase [Thalassospira sp. MCCC 1A01148]MBR9901706.1 5-formyltetrahydrofolate cyclo-ligase [Rhodospirillales bacterium]NIY77242.1 5-formyltetrahydrofolate cyclo-ligase [Thalassospira sp. HF15]RCK20959.1 5-formyltetrahydrofolate cyclo-ligase [Thalassospira profundimaris]
MSTSKVVRERIWSKLHDVAKPDTRFHLNFAEVIPDFDGSEQAVDKIVETEAYQKSEFAFITPDNCLADLRRRMIEDGKTFVMSTYGIYRGFLLLEPSMVPDGAALYASWLDGMEHFGRPITLEEIAKRGRFDYMVTGASAVSMNGVRFGKGHGFFDLEWGMFTDLGLVDETTPVVAVVHDVQVVEEMLQPSETDILVDQIMTPTRVLDVGRRAKRPSGVKWPLLDPKQIEETPPLQELQRIQGLA